jgi:16S rRNA processing protein RimM
MSEPSTSGRGRDPAQRRRSWQRRRGNRSTKSIEVPEGHLAVGQITGAHGLQGELKIELHTDFPEERFAPGQQVFIGQELKDARIQSSRPQQDRLLVYFEGIEGRTAADNIVGEWIYIPEDEAIELDEDTYYVHQIVGLAVHTTGGVKLGTVRDVLFTGANEVYLVQPDEGINQGKELLIPAIADVVQAVNLDQGTITVHLLPGMLEE